MRLPLSDFRNYLDEMISNEEYKQAKFWVENGTLIYSNYDELQDVYEEEYRDAIHVN